MKHTLLAGFAAITLIAGTGLVSAQQNRDQSGAPGTGMSEPAPSQAPAATGTTGQRAPSITVALAPAPSANPNAPPTQPNSADTRDRDQEGTPGTGKSAPAAGGSPRQ
jgi:hypothetical protein